MTISITVTDGHVDGYLSSSEYAKKYGLSKNVIRIWIYRGKFKTSIRIGDQNFIKEDEPVPAQKKRGRKAKSNKER